MRGRDRKNHGQTLARSAVHGTTRVGAALQAHAQPPAQAAAAFAEAPEPVETVDAAEPAERPVLSACPVPLDEPEVMLPLDEHWCQWIVDSVLQRMPHDAMMARLKAERIDPAQTSGFIGALPRNPMYRAAEKMRDRYERYGRAMQNVHSLRESGPEWTHVEKRSRLSRDEFIERYVRGCRPVVITDMARDWPAMQRWSFAEFKRRYGAMTVQVQAGREKDADFEVNKMQHKHTTNFAAFLDRVVTSGPNNDEYLTANNELLRRPEFQGLLDEVGPLPDYCDPSSLTRCASLWVGPEGTKTPLHHDTLMLLHTQIVGRKRWRFIAPSSAPRLYNDFDVYSPVNFENLDLARFPEAAGVKVLEVVVEPGESVFLPLAWWHQVTSLDKCISLSFTNIDVPNRFDFGNGH